jgi:hypothetical protein
MNWRKHFSVEGFKPLITGKIFHISVLCTKISGTFFEGNNHILQLFISSLKLLSF